MADTKNPIIVPAVEWNRLKRSIETLVKANETNGYISEQEVCILLGINRKVLTNYMSNGKMPPECYSVGIGNNKFFNKAKVMGL